MFYYLVVLLMILAQVGAFSRCSRFGDISRGVLPRRVVGLAAKNPGNSEGKGFGVAKKVKITETPDASPSPPPSSRASPESSSYTPEMASRDSVLSEEEKEAEVQKIFAKYGIKNDETADFKKQIAARKLAGEEAPFGESVIANMDSKVQAKTDSILVACVSVSLSFVVLCGIGISAGALHVVFPDITIPTSIDDLIVNVLTPAFTPALGIFFFFSITFGLFKFAQVSSSQTVYRES